jgi:hypothetical protein
MVLLSYQAYSILNFKFLLKKFFLDVRNINFKGFSKPVGFMPKNYNHLLNLAMKDFHPLEEGEKAAWLFCYYITDLT